ncbi:hypothetical protein Tco_1245104 [Tanacetum coccineum]
MGMTVGGVVAGDGEWRVAESGVVDRIDRLIGSIFGLGLGSPTGKSFTGGRRAACGGGGRRLVVAGNEREKRGRFKRISLTGFPAQKRRISNTDVLFALASSHYGTSQSRQHVDTSLIHIESRKSPTAVLFDVDTRRISTSSL